MSLAVAAAVVAATHQSYEEIHSNAFCQNQDKTGFTVRHEQRLVTLGNTVDNCADYCAANAPCNVFQTYAINENDGTGNGLCRLFNTNVVGCNSADAIGMNVYKLTDESAADADILAELTSQHTSSRTIDTSDKAQGDAVTPQMYHWNEDAHSVPLQIFNKPSFTATQAKYDRMGKNDLDTERFSVDPQFATQYSLPSTEPITEGYYTLAQLGDIETDTNVELEEQIVLWRKSGMVETTPESSHLVQYDESEGPTKADNGQNDNLILNRAAWGAIGWTNPLSWKDDGSDDDLVVGPVA